MTFQLSAVLDALIKRVPGDGPESKKVRASLQELRTEGEAVLKIMSERNAMESDAAHKMRVDAAKERFRKFIANMRPAVEAEIQRARVAEAAKQREQAKLAPNEYAAEIRTVFRGLDSAGQHQFLGKAIRDRDAATVAALVDVPHVLTGLTPQQQADYRRSFLDSAAPVSKVADDMTSAYEAAVRHVESFAK